VALEEKVRSVSRRAPVLVEPGATLRTAARGMWLESVGALVLGDRSNALGVLSERDVVAEIARGGDPDVVTAREVMTGHIVATRFEDPLHEAAYQMLDNAIRHVPVVDEYGRVVGMVSIRDLLRPILLEGMRG
jgi:CBS domain-containing protein